MTGAWKAVPGSEGAGHVSSDIALLNTSGKTCTVNGFPQIKLFTAADHALPTTVSDFGPPPAAALSVAPGGSVHSELRYSPHIPGPGEPQDGSPCEPAAAYALVQLPADTAWIKVPLDTPTSVCEKGSIQAKAFADGPATPPGG